MKVIEPASLVREAAEVLAPIWEDVVVIGAAALQILLADDLDGSTLRAAATRDLDIAIVTPTRDVDLAVEARLADAIVARLEEAGLEPSEEPYERGYTWIRNDLKIQLVRPFHPFPSGTAGRLPQNPHLSLLARDEHRLVVAFRNARDEPRLQTATEAALVALKQVAFGRSRPGGEPVERDYHDVHLIVSHRPDALESSYRVADYHVRSLVDNALELLAAGGPATEAAARQQAEITGDRNVAAHERAVVRAAVFMQRRLAGSADA